MKSDTRPSVRKPRLLAGSHGPRADSGINRVCSLIFPMLLGLGCTRQPPPSDDAHPATTVATSVTTAAPATSSTALAQMASDAAPPAATALPHPGPWLTILRASAAVYSEPTGERSKKLGYAQSGARLPVDGPAKPGPDCSSGWLHETRGGFVCTAVGTLDDKDPRVRFTQRSPDLKASLPYRYARNAKNGTPLYRSIPTRAQMLQYEPYLRPKDEQETTSPSASAGPTVPRSPASGPDAGLVRPTSSAPEPTDAGPVSANPSLGSRPVDAGVIATDSPEVESMPWWQQQDIEDRLHEVKLSDLREGSDDVLELRMVKGFYIAIDRTFTWHGRTWYKTTKGLVAPADRMGIADASEFQGLEIGDECQLPVGWVYGWREDAATYEIEPTGGNPKVKGRVKRFAPLKLTGKTWANNQTRYVELADGTWIRESHIRQTTPGEPPEGIGVTERWIDIDLSSQTLVVFEGKRPIYATLVSTGKSSKIKEKDHSTPTGKYRIREKHLATTMDGDGSAAGDLPYSIEDVPYVMYFHRSYAVHGAFWHRNYGMQMSHGCVNLSPRDARAVFFLTQPNLPEQWHGTWSSDDRPGSWVVIHE